MKKTQNYLKILLGCLLISIGFNYFIIPSQLIPSGILGTIAACFYEYNFNPALILFLINAWALWLVYIIHDKKRLKTYLLPSIIIPILIYITSFYKIDLTNSVEELLLAVSGAFVMGYGYGILYKQGYKVGVINILEDIFNNLFKKNNKILSRSYDLILILTCIYSFGIEQALYSSIVIVIIRRMTTKAKIGISDSKAFYIITTKVDEVKDYIIKELTHDLTIFDAEGGYSKKKSKVIMTVISSKDYFKVKEGIKLIDPNAFISVTDSYEVLNKNVQINE